MDLIFVWLLWVSEIPVVSRYPVNYVSDKMVREWHAITQTVLVRVLHPPHSAHPDVVEKKIQTSLQVLTDY